MWLFGVICLVCAKNVLLGITHGGCRQENDLKWARSHLSQWNLSHSLCKLHVR